MDKTISIATLPLRGGHPSLDFANTVDSRRDRWGPDVLLSYSDLLAWAQRTGVLDQGEVRRLARQAAFQPEEADAALSRAKRLREAIYDVFSALAGEHEVPGHALELLQDEYVKAQGTRYLALAKGAVAWTWAEAIDLDAVVYRLAVETLDLLTGPKARRVKECLGRNCGWLFLDTSRNGSRRWCSDAVCGSLSRVTKHRSKARPAPSCEDM